MTTLQRTITGRLAYREAGNGRPIVLVHGWGVSGALFEAQREVLSDRFRIVAPDLPGHGGSGAFPADAPFTDLSDAIAGLVAELRLGPVLLAGWSLGAMIAWDLVRGRRIPVAGLVTIDMVPHLVNEPDWPYELRGAMDLAALLRDVPAMRADWPAYAESFVPRIVAPVTAERHPELLARVTAIAKANDADSMANIWLRMAEQDFRAALAAMDIPALVVAGALSDLYSTSASRWIAGRLPRGRLEVFEQSGHSPHLEEPARFNQVLSAFADELDFENRTAVSQSH